MKICSIFSCSFHKSWWSPRLSNPYLATSSSVVVWIFFCPLLHGQWTRFQDCFSVLLQFCGLASLGKSWLVHLQPWSFNWWWWLSCTLIPLTTIPWFPWSKVLELVQVLTDGSWSSCCWPWFGRFGWWHFSLENLLAFHFLFGTWFQNHISTVFPEFAIKLQD